MVRDGATPVTGSWRRRVAGGGWEQLSAYGGGVVTDDWGRSGGAA